jgi:serine protease Do
MAEGVRWRRGLAAGMVAAAVGLAGALTTLGRPAPADSQPEGAAEAEAAARDIDMARSLSRAFQNAARTIEPSVVHITSRTVQRGRDLFGRPIKQESRGVGSGVIVTADGYILTNNHVVAEAEEVVAKTNDGRLLSGRVVGTDASTDLAVVKVDATGLTAAQFGDSEELQVGEWVLAVGSPFGTFDNTVTAGIVSAMNRTGLAGEGSRFEDYIQTDAAINPGNSGGPLVNLEGRVVGINSQIATRTGGSIGIGFSIPSSIARAVMDMLIRTGRVERGWLGVTIRDLRPEEASRLGISPATGGVPGGVLVESVVPGSPAEDAGLATGDVVVGFKGRVMTGANRLINAITFTPSGTRVRLDVLRDGRPTALTAEIIDQATWRRATLDPVAVPRIGASVAPVPDYIASRLGDRAPTGVMIVDIEPGGFAEQWELQAGDVIVAINGSDVQDAAEFVRTMGRLDLRRRHRLSLIGERDGVMQRGYLDIGGE